MPGAEDNAELYERDFDAWTRITAGALRQRRFGAVDADLLAQELEDMGARDRRELGRRFALVIAHLLKWRYEPEKRTSSWRDTIAVQRADLLDLLEDSPSLRPRVAEIVAKYYGRAVLMAAADGPPECPWSPEQLLDSDFLPE